METGTSSRSGDTWVGTVNTKRCAGAFATLYTPFVARASHVGHGHTSIGDVVDDVSSGCTIIALHRRADIAETEKEEETEKDGTASELNYL